MEISVDPVGDLPEKIAAEQVRLIYRQGPVLSLGAAAAAAVIALHGQQTRDDNLHLYWFSIVALSALLRLALCRFHSMANSRAGSARKWGHRFALASATAGIVWGSWPFVFHPTASTEYLMMVSAVVAGMIAVLANSGSVFLPAFYCFALPLCLPFVVFHVQSGVAVLVWTGWLLSMFFLVNLLLALRSNRQYRDLCEARFSNHWLLAQLAQEKQVAESAVEAKNSFIASASHDLRQPLHALTMLIAALSRTRLGKRQSLIMQDIRKSNTALHNHFNAILDISRLESDALTISREELMLPAIVEELLQEFQAEAVTKKLHLAFDCKLPSPFVVSDRVLLERILRNLLSNAVRFTASGSITVDIKADDDGVISLQVRDTGVGIAAEHLDSIFDEYYSRGESSGGLGLGLSIVKRLCKLLDIDVAVESVADANIAAATSGGTCFTLKFKQQALQLQQMATLAPDAAGKHLCRNEVRADIDQPNGGDRNVCLAGRTVLVIDDESDILRASQILFESMEVNAITAANAREALTDLAQSGLKPDAILCDYRLADGENGLDVIETVRQWYDESLPACIITGETSPNGVAAAELKRALQDTDIPVLHKPLSALQLEQSLQSLCSGKG